MHVPRRRGLSKEKDQVRRPKRPPIISRLRQNTEPNEPEAANRSGRCSGPGMPGCRHWLWSLRSLIWTGTATRMALYDMIGKTYNASRQPGSRIAARLLELLSLPAGSTVADIAQRCSRSFWRFWDSATDLIRGVLAWAAEFEWKPFFLTRRGKSLKEPISF